MEISDVFESTSGKSHMIHMAESSTDCVDVKLRYQAQCQGTHLCLCHGAPIHPVKLSSAAVSRKQSSPTSTTCLDMQCSAESPLSLHCLSTTATTPQVSCRQGETCVPFSSKCRKLLKAAWLQADYSSNHLITHRC